MDYEKILESLKICSEVGTSLTAFRDAPETPSGKQVALFSIAEATVALAGKGGAKTVKDA